MTSSSHNHPKVPARDEDGRLIRQEDWNFLAERCDTLAKTLAAKDAEVAGWLRTSQVQDERIDELRAERDRLAANVASLEKEIARLHVVVDETAKHSWRNP